MVHMTHILINHTAGWEEYKIGFGNVNKEYWIGLQHLYQMTTRRKYKLKVDLEDWDGRWFYAVYDTFFIQDEDEEYRLVQMIIINFVFEG